MRTSSSHCLKSFGVSLLLALLFSSCASTKNALYTDSPKPRPDQARWTNESELTQMVVRCVKLCELATTEEKALLDYALYLRNVYAYCSLNGTDVDAGVRAINHVYKVHRQTGGSRDLWNKVLKQTQLTPKNVPEKQKGLPPPNPPATFSFSEWAEPFTTWCSKKYNEWK